jgi:polysaccharide export outer membrane protein
MKSALRSAALIVLAVALAASCAGKTGTAAPAVTSTASPSTGPLYALAAGGAIKVQVWDGDALFKEVTVKADGTVVDAVLDATKPAPAAPKLTAWAIQGRDFYQVPLRAVSPLAYDTDYVIGPEDELEIQVWKNDELSKKVQVRPDGKVTLPLVNDVQAAGQTRSQFQAKLVEAFKAFVGVPEVTVTIAATHSYKVFVQGRVHTPGAYPIKQSTTIVQAIAMAGGFDEWADRRDILVIRRSAAGESRATVNYDRIVRARDAAPDFVLLPGDTIVVP